MRVEVAGRNRPDRAGLYRSGARMPVLAAAPALAPDQGVCSTNAVAATGALLGDSRVGSPRYIDF